MMEVDLYNFPDRFIKERHINEWFLKKFAEVQGILKEIVEKEREIVESSSSRNKDDENEVDEHVITLMDVFRVVERRKYPFLWNSVLCVLSYIPTSVSCERNFSILRRRMHENMKSETAFAFVEMAKNNNQIEF